MNAFENILRDHGSIFETLNDDAIARVAGLCEEGHYEAGHFIFRECDTDDDLFIVAAGKVAIGHNLGHDDDEDEIGRLDPGETLGEMSMFDGLPRSMDARAVTDTRVLRIRKHRLQELIHGDPSLGVRILENLARHISFRLRRTNWDRSLLKDATSQ